MAPALAVELLHSGPQNIGWTMALSMIGPPWSTSLSIDVSVYRGQLSINDTEPLAIMADAQMIQSFAIVCLQQSCLARIQVSPRARIERLAFVRYRTSIAEAAKKNKVSEQTVRARRKHFSEVEPNDVKRLKALKSENGKLKRLLAERDLEIDLMRQVNRKNGEPTGQTVSK
jgi:putative transposase